MFATTPSVFAINYSGRRGIPLTPDQWIFVQDIVDQILVLYLIMLVSVPFFVVWTQKQRVTSEILLYQIRGKFTYYNVLLWIEQIERRFKTRLTSVRKKMELMNKNSEKRKKSIAHFYKGDITRLLFALSFGPKRRRCAYARMHRFSKFYVLSLLFIVILPFFYTITFWWGYTAPQGFKDKNFMLIGFLIALITGVTLWLFIYISFNITMYFVEMYLVKRKGHAGYFHIFSAQMDGFFKGIWYRKPFPQAALMRLTDIEIKDGRTDIVFNDFKGGGAGGSW